MNIVEIAKTPINLRSFNPMTLIHKLKLGRKGNIKADIIFHQLKNDANKSLVRLNNRLIKSHNNPNGLVRHDSLVTVYNKDSQKYTTGYACGCGDRYTFRGDNYIALDYKQRLYLELGEKATKGDLEMWPATAQEARVFYSHHHFDSAARVAHRSSIKMNVLFFVLTLVGLFNVIDIILG